MQATQTEASRRTPSDRIPWGWVIATAVGLEVATVASAIAWVAIYSYLIHPGEDPAYYQEYAQVSSPVIAAVLGGPYWFLGCRWIARKAGSRAVAMSLAAWLVGAAATANIWARVCTPSLAKHYSTLWIGWAYLRHASAPPLLPASASLTHLLAGPS